jgi:hemoglobin/transferrin/lactoferrin receptor protein
MSAPGARAQSQEESTQLPPLEVSAKQPKTKKKQKASNKPAPAAAPAAAAVEPQPSPEQTATTVSAEPSIGTNSTDITSQDLARLNPSDLQDVFRDVPGVQVSSPIPTSQKIYVNGIEETNLAVTVDGSRQNNKVFHHSGTNLIDPALLKAVRVDAGVAPADAGPGALAGSIMFETKDARDLLEPGQSQGGFASASYETNGDIFRTGASAYGIVGAFEYLGYVNYADGDNFESGDGTEVSGTAPKLLSGLGKMAWQSDSGERLEVSHEYITDDGLRPFRANIGQVGGPRPDRLYDLERRNTVFTFTDTKPRGWWDPKVVVAYSVTELAVPEPWGSVGETDSFNGKFENKFSFATGNVIAGIDFFDDEATYAEPGYFAAESATNVGVYAQARVKPWSRTRLSFGARGDNIWFEGTDGSKFQESGLSGNVSGEYDLTDWLMATAGYSHVWGGIPFAENYIANPAWNYGSGPRPVTADNYTTGLVATFGDVRLDARIYQTEIDNARNASFANPLQAFDLESKGFELGARYSWRSSFASIRYASVDVTLDGVAIDSYYGNYIGTPIGDIISIAFAHEFVGTGFTVGGDIEIAFKNDDPLENDVDPADPKRAIPGYEVANLFVQYVPPAMSNLTLRLDAKNIFDENYVSRATYGQDYATVLPLYEPGRSFVLSAKTKF